MNRGVHFFVQRRILGIWVCILRGNMAWEVNLGRLWVQVPYRDKRKQWGWIKVGRWPSK